MREVTFKTLDNFIIYDNLPTADILPALTYRKFYAELNHFDREIIRLWFIEEICSLQLTCVSPEQVHGSVISETGDGARVTGADGLITDDHDYILSIVVADCLPIYLWEKSGKAFSLIHAGWRGSADDITGKAITLFAEKYGIKSGDLAALLGPCICQKCFEVGPEVVEQFPDSVVKRGVSHRSYLDLRQANALRLIEGGVPADSIYTDSRCTFCEEDLFYSYRRDGTTTGRMYAAFGFHKLT